MSFYYWKTSFQLDSAELEALSYNHVSILHIRYFDIDKTADDSFPHPVSPIRFDTSWMPTDILPVIFIKNRSLTGLDSGSVIMLAKDVYHLVNRINNSRSLKPQAIQFDCDWTEQTKNNYFLFLRTYKTISKMEISATIRLHQIKYSLKAGIPPIDYGVLMYYNMGEINSTSSNSIYEKGIAEKYSSFIQHYPLPLDLALPIFGWSQQIRDGKVIQLLNKMSFEHFEQDASFVKIKKDWYVTAKSCFHGGYYFKQRDEVKAEQVSFDELSDIVEDVNKHSNGKIKNLIFFDLDKENLSLYEKESFRKMLAALY